MAALPKGLTQDDLNRYAKLDAGIKKLTTEKSELGALIKSKVVKTGTYVWGKVVVKRSEARTKDISAAEARYPRSEYPHLYVATTTYALDWDALSKDDQESFTKVVDRLSVDVTK